MDTKHLSGVIPLDLHQRASEEIRETESTMSNIHGNGYSGTL